jgi:hypothetical protein
LIPMVFLVSRRPMLACQALRRPKYPQIRL